VQFIANNTIIHFVYDENGAVLFLRDSGNLDSRSVVLDLEHLEVLRDEIDKAVKQLKEEKRTSAQKAASQLHKHFTVSGGFPSWLQGIGHTPHKIVVYAKRELYNYEKRDIPRTMTVDGQEFSVELIVSGPMVL
jgi:uncharacterized protein (UPF0210 family)